jgi:energy-coupling factor transporter ATP-binding protein EcfA2
MLNTGEEGLKPTEALSGGETARLLFCRIMLQKPNVLVLDEPTNHLDLESINALNIALQKYEGTVFLVTHDEDLMEEVGTRVWHFDGRTIQDFKGTYEEYRFNRVACRLRLTSQRRRRSRRLSDAMRQVSMRTADIDVFLVGAHGALAIAFFGCSVAQPGMSRRRRFWK